MTPAQFVEKWLRVQLAEKAASQEHFIDLCRLLGQPTPAEHDATGAEYTFEKHVAVTGPASRGSQGEYGFVDVWWRGRFAWEYKRKDKYRHLDEAYQQLHQYVEDLENPPLLVVSDIRRTEIHTHFTGQRSEVHRIDLAELDQPRNLDLLRRVFTDPDSFRTAASPEAVTEEIARHIGLIAQSLQQRGHDAHTAAHFLMRAMFCLFAEDVDLLPEGLFSRLLTQWRRRPDQLTDRLTDLFTTMRTGGAFGAEPIAWFNGGLFDEAPALTLSESEVDALLVAAKQDWGRVEPAIFGTLFERSLDPSKRAQIGAHYTSRDDIMLVVEPVIMEPLRRKWQAVKDEVERQLQKRRKSARSAARNRITRSIHKALEDFLHRLGTVRILDPACGSGNFLYVAIQQLLYLEKEVIRYAAGNEIGLNLLLPTVRPTQLHGIEINPYAAELAQVVIWIGYLQWMRDNGFRVPTDPILEPLQTIECRDAILDFTASPSPSQGEGGGEGERPRMVARPPQWPEADFIVGNPPFLGSKLFRQSGLPDDYVQAMYTAFDLPKSSDLCCYWFELARREIERRPHVRAGLLATQGIRGGANRTVLQRIKQTGDIFMAWSDREWVLEGANVHVSIVGFDGGNEAHRRLDGSLVASINPDLSSELDTTGRRVLPENLNIAFMGTTKGGPFDLEWEVARKLLSSPNPHGRANFEVVRPWVNGSDLTKRTRAKWIVDFGCEMPENVAALYEEPYQLVLRTVYPTRSLIRQELEAARWWLHNRARSEMRAAIAQLTGSS